MTGRYSKTFLVLSLFLYSASSVQAQKNYKDLSYSELGDIQIPSIKQVTLTNGIKLFLLEDHELPLINLSGRLRCGSIYEPSEKIGLASITGVVMRTGGSTTRPGDLVDELLENIAASVETRISENSALVSMSVLKQDLDTGLNILSDILMDPAFPEEKIRLAKIEERSAVARRNDSAGGIARREFKKLIYGKDSPYARHTEYATIDSISREDLVNFHKKYFHPNNMWLAVWGDFETKEMIDHLEKIFQNWKPKELQFSEVPLVNYEYRQTLNFIQKNDVNQSNIFIGHIGGVMSDEDYFALTLMNRILGSGFTSRLFREVRSRQGLAYSVFGAYTAYYDHPGILYLGCQTKSETTVKAINSMMNEVKKITLSEVTDEELKIARESYLNSFVFNFDSTSEIVNRLMTYAYFGYPLDFLQKSKDRIEQVTKADILKVAKKHLRPNQMQILVVGQLQNQDQSLSALGSVNQIKISIPNPKGKSSTATP